MRTEEVKVYQFEELSDEAKEKARDWFKEDGFDYDWWEDVYNIWEEKLTELEYDVTKVTREKNKKGEYYDKKEILINFSGFYSQGDGASFTGEVDVVKWLKRFPENKDYKRILKLIDSNFVYPTDSSIVRDRWHNYVHWNTTSLNMNWDMNGRLGTSASNVMKVLDEIEAAIFAEHQQLNKDIYTALEKEWDSLNSDEYVDETIMANEYEFTEEGKRWT